MNEAQKEFHLREYEKLNNELSWMLASTSSIAQYTVLVAASVFAWLATQSIGVGVGDVFCYKLPKEILTVAWYIPFIVALLAGLIVGATHIRVRAFGSYLRKVEERFQVSPLGWESALRRKYSLPTIAFGVFWSTLLLGTLLTAFEATSFIELNVTKVCEPRN